MFYKVLLILLIPIIILAQSTRNQVENSDFEIYYRWNNWSGCSTFELSTEQAQSGSHSYKLTGNGGDGAQQSLLDTEEFPAGVTVRYGIGVYSNSSVNFRFSLLNSSYANTALYNTAISSGSWSNKEAISTTSDASTMIYFITLGTDTWYFDDAFCFVKKDTLWIDGSQADDTNNDTTKTLTEAFENRWVHSGGTFIIAPGTYNESITIDSSFAKLEASGPVTVTNVDFNNVTCTVDLANLTITTKLNDSNVTYINQPVEPQTPTTFRGLISLWRFEASGNIPDLVGSNTLTPTATLPTRTVEGRQCILTSSSSQYEIAHTSQTGLDFGTTSWSMHFRIACNDTIFSNILYRKRTTSPTVGIDLAIDFRDIQRGYQQGTNDGWPSNTAPGRFIDPSGNESTLNYTLLDTTVLHSLAFVFNAESDSFYCYVNGAQIDTAKNIAAVGSCDNTGDVILFIMNAGVVYEVAVADVAWTAAEINELYTGNYSSTIKPRGYMRFDGYSGYSLSDVK